MDDSEGLGTVMPCTFDRASPIDLPDHSPIWQVRTISTDAHCLLNTHHSLLNTHHSLLNTHHSLLNTHHSLLNTHHSLLNTHHRTALC
ncbi:hypothetical protein SV7mr_15640 [Stieleria bergensis]|uniref:Uncharacterized protein n=1 Tax=Stieleria bergensis TaxID=2528025 RepID=A0A517SSF9_9BACT|nr:hypothetical protein SV7mr_15640 [Planctomycetes bacterium SV_7m_r]